MSLLFTWTLVLAGAWLAALTVVVVLLLRQVAIHQVQLSSRSTVAMSFDGPPIGRGLPPEVVNALPPIQSAHTHVLFISATCMPCRELVSGLQGRVIGQSVVTLLTGRREMAEDLGRLLPHAFTVVHDPIAGEIAQSLNLNSTPFVLEVRDGVVTRKKYVMNTGDFVGFITSTGT